MVGLLIAAVRDLDPPAGGAEMSLATLLKGVCEPGPLPEAEVLQKEIGLLTEALAQRDLSSALDSMKRLVPEYNPNNGQ